MTRHQQNKNGGFTLLELLIVIAIIALLAGITVVGTQKALESTKASKVKMQISQLEMALDRYKDQIGEYPPDDFTNDEAVRRHIKRRWPRLQYREADLTGANIADVNGDGQVDVVDAFVSHAYDSTVTGATPDKASYVAALVFWLGGLPDSNHNPIGFYLQPKDPLGLFADKVNEGQREEPFFKFPEGTIVVSRGIPAFVPGKKDDKPIVYFRADGATDTWRQTAAEENRPKGVYAAYVPYTDAELNNASLIKYTLTKFYDFGGDLGVAAPYAAGETRVDAASDRYEYAWQEPERFQLVHPGADGKFSTGSDDYVPGETARRTDTQVGITEGDADNLVNFTSGATLDSEW